jgi:hypothetical protein
MLYYELFKALRMRWSLPGRRALGPLQRGVAFRRAGAHDQDERDNEVGGAARGEIRLNQWCRGAADWHTESVIKHIYQLISQDEARHGGAHLWVASTIFRTFDRVVASI